MRKLIKEYIKGIIREIMYENKRAEPTFEILNVLDEIRGR